MTLNELYDLYLAHPTVTTDTRDCPEGSIFFALRGASFNGNEFALQALAAGCAYAVAAALYCDGEWKYLESYIIEGDSPVHEARSGIAVS